ncbi:MAG TPA: hypothetical protein VLG49_01025 [Rhabdochlamydiaceae bacterium]|nr:hypothetical protein [Rhabdochlamydiaceae bacterium]
MQHKIGSVINFCTNDVRFLAECVNNAKQISSQVVISVCDHFFDGKEENYPLLESIYNRFTDCLFIEFAFDPEAPYGKNAPFLEDDLERIHHWHNSGRLVPFYFLDPSIEYIFFLDVDEIVDAQKFNEWLDGFNYRQFSAHRFPSYWYFREARYRATTFPVTSLMVEKAALNPDLLLDLDERMGVFYNLKGEKNLHSWGLDEKPMIHHYSWVRTKEEMLKKVHSWGHHWERNWDQLISEEYSRNFNGKDFVRYYEYETIEPHFDPLVLEMPEYSVKISLERHIQNIQKCTNVRRVNARDIFRMDLSFKFGLGL